MPAIDQQLIDLAHRLATLLRERQLRIVFAESCTGGLASMVMTNVPGVSEHFCGSAVTYRNETKARWLGVSRAHLADPNIGPVSSLVAEQMCQGVLSHTPEADLAVAITGHLGPDAPAELDGTVYIGVAFRDVSTVSVQRRKLSSIAPPAGTLRQLRQQEATRCLLEAAFQAIQQRNAAPADRSDPAALQRPPESA